MKIAILEGSPRINGNTASVLPHFIAALEENGAEVVRIRLHGKRIEPCTACRSCQRDFTSFGCAHSDDMHEIFSLILESDLFVLATPIYSWFCPAPMKAALDRLVYGMNKFYGETKGPSLWAGKSCALLVTCGYPPAKGADLFEEGMKRYCKHSRLSYAGMLALHDLGYSQTFLDDEKLKQTGDFAYKLLGSL